MKPIIPLSAAALAMSALITTAPFAGAQTDKKPVTKSQSTSTSTQVISRNGKAVGTVTVTVNNDGKVETKTWKIGDSTAGVFVPYPPADRATAGGSTGGKPGAIKVSPIQKMEKATWLGVAIVNISDDVATQLPLPKGAGLRVQHVEKGSPADKAGIQTDDLIFKVDEQIIFTIEQFRALIRTYKAGSEVEVTLFRKGTRKTVRATLETHEFLASNSTPVQVPFNQQIIRWNPSIQANKNADLLHRKRMEEFTTKLRDESLGAVTQRRAIIVSPDGTATVLKDGDIEVHIRESVRKALEDSGADEKTIKQALESIEKSFGAIKKPATQN